MPTFDTPEPISVTLEFDVGSARITAGKRADTVVEVLPGDGADEDDVQAAQQTRVTCSGGKLLVRGPKKRSLFGKSGSLDVSIELPAGSDVQGTSSMADFTCEGHFGDLRLRTSFGDIQVEEAGTVSLKTDHGDIRVDRTAGDAEVIAAGRIDVGEIAGAATVKNVNGETSIGSVTGALRVNSSNGRISVGIAHAGVDAKSASGGIRIGEVARGQVSLQTAAGDLEVGIAASTAAWLDVNTRSGMVRNSIGPSEGPATSDETVEVHARTGAGDVVIRRS
ncbi:hypothetical protein SLUN_38355 (plasmid) [Streptomyces lunaelactis]|uniref:DUF4097 domain-containing protein n=1 Tax=Streptomyces lunaelactis TaxID=1535768 RepID=A0A2R4TFK3_9ACTN|nr:DUF4097 family beta strand repeat-containing protein [Streptomyces lunaelactis]AVZ77901.1 hypothetical protein SLUN_38355 [Streptomyces lunaelactis]NUK83439.1 DUF4097 family beta strand repeat protein [Streptomyces lunaelactis]